LEMVRCPNCDNEMEIKWENVKRYYICTNCGYKEESEISRKEVEDWM